MAVAPPMRRPDVNDLQAARILARDSEWDVPDEAFMLLVLHEHAMQGVSGLAKYRDEFAGVE